MTGKQDLRVKKTQRALASAMLMLLEVQSFGKITVNDLCTEAMVSRSAFYTHYEDKYALLGYCLEMLKNKLFADTEDMDIRGRIYEVLEKTLENVKMFRNLLMSELDEELMEMFRSAFHEDFEQLMKKHQKAKDVLPGPPEVISAYYAAGITSAILYWVREKTPYSTDEMADCLYALLPTEFS